MSQIGDLKGGRRHLARCLQEHPDILARLGMESITDMELMTDAEVRMAIKGLQRQANTDEDVPPETEEERPTATEEDEDIFGFSDESGKRAEEQPAEVSINDLAKGLLDVADRMATAAALADVSNKVAGLRDDTADGCLEGMRDGMRDVVSALADPDNPEAPLTAIRADVASLRDATAENTNTTIKEVVTTVQGDGEVTRTALRDIKDEIAGKFRKFVLWVAGGLAAIIIIGGVIFYVFPPVKTVVDVNPEVIARSVAAKFEATAKIDQTALRQTFRDVLRDVLAEQPGLQPPVVSPPSEQPTAPAPTTPPAGTSKWNKFGR